MGPYGPLWALLDRPWQVRTCPISDFWPKFACFGFKTGLLTKFLDDSQWFLLEKLKHHITLIQNLNIRQKNLKVFQTTNKLRENLGTPVEIPVDTLAMGLAKDLRFLQRQNWSVPNGSVMDIRISQHRNQSF